MRISANRNTISVIGFWRPVSTFASLIGAFSGSVALEIVTEVIRSRLASPRRIALKCRSFTALVSVALVKSRNVDSLVMTTRFD